MLLGQQTREFAMGQPVRERKEQAWQLLAATPTVVNPWSELRWEQPEGYPPDVEVARVRLHGCKCTIWRYKDGKASIMASHPDTRTIISVYRQDTLDAMVRYNDFYHYPERYL